MVRNKLEYNGPQYPHKPRQLREDEFIETSKQDAKKPQFETREEVVTRIFDNAAKAFLKGETLKKRLGEMNPGDWIPIIETDARVSEAARRRDPDQSQGGTVLTYGMFQKCVDEVLQKKQRFKKHYLNIQAGPTSHESQSTSNEVDNESDNFLDNLIEQFLSENSIAGIVMGMLTLSPFQGIIFQSFSTEQSGRTVQAIQIPAGLALLIELGIKGEQLYKFFKGEQFNFALVEEQINLMKDDPAARAKALEGIGIDYDKLKDGFKDTDCRLLIDYFTEYFNRYGGMLEPDSNITLDHWVAYMQVAQNQQYLRGALNTADKFSTKYNDLKYGDSPSTLESEGTISNYVNNSGRVSASIDLLSVTRELTGTSNTVYDDIASTFSHYLTDRDMCCLVQIFGGTMDVEALRTIALVLRMLAVNLSGNITNVLNVFRRALQRVIQDVLFELMGQLNEVYDKIQSKLQQVFTLEIEGLEACGGLMSIGFAIMQSVQAMYDQMHWMMRDLMQIMSDFGDVEDGSWEVAADRRHLVGMANLLTTLANRLELASICEDDSVKVNRTSIDRQELTDEAAAQIIYNMIERPAPVLQLTNNDIDKHFSHLTLRESQNLKFKYGINVDTASQDGSVHENVTPCTDAISQPQIQELIRQVTSNMNRVFGNENRPNN